MVKNLTNKRTPILSVINDREGHLLTTASDISNRWHEYCTDLYSVNPQGDETVMQTYRKGNGDPEPFAEWEVRAAISRIPTTNHLALKHSTRATLSNSRRNYTVYDIGMQQYIMYRKMARTVDQVIDYYSYRPTKKGNLKDCKNYRTISLISHPSKIMLRILLSRLQPKIDALLSKEQAGFRKKQLNKSLAVNCWWKNI